jgi:hypothetical protein
LLFPALLQDATRAEVGELRVILAQASTRWRIEA